jgi:hypothetical protein
MAGIGQPPSVTNDQRHTVKRAARFTASYTGDNRPEAVEQLFHMLSDSAGTTGTVDWIYSAYFFF